MNNFGFIDPSDKSRAYHIPNTFLADVKTFCHGQYLANDKYYEVKYFSDHSVLVEEKSNADLKIQNFLKTLLTITGLAYLIGMAIDKYSSDPFADRSVILTGKIKGYDLNEFMKRTEAFPESRIPHLTLDDGIKREIEACPNKTALANLFVTITNHKTTIVEEFVTQRKFPSRYLETMCNQLSNLPIEKLINWDFNSEEEMIEFLIIAQWYNKHYRTIIDDGFIELLIGKSLDIINQGDPKKMAAVLEYIRFSFGEKVVGKILLHKVVEAIDLKFEQLPQDWKSLFIKPFENMFKLHEAWMVLIRLSYNITVADFHLPSFLEELERLNDLIPEDIQMWEGERLYEGLKDHLETLAVEPTKKILDIADLITFKEIYDPIAARFKIPEIWLENDTSGDGDIANMLQLQVYQQG